MSAPPVTTLADVVRTVVQLLINVGTVATANDGSGGTARVYHGDEYLDQNDTPPRLVFVQQGGKIGPVLAVGAREVASVRPTCEIHIWGAGPSDDARMDDAWARAHRVINAFVATASGRITGEALTRDDSPRILRHGEQIVLRYTYEWAVPEDPEIWLAAYALAPADPGSPPDPDRPFGDTGSTFVVNVTPQNLRS